MITAALALALSTAQIDKDPFGIAWGFLYGYSGVPSPEFMPKLRSIGGGWTKLYLIWNQLEPKKGSYDWHALDTFLAQVHKPEEALISVFSASNWATRLKSDMLPPSPAKDPADYDRFIRALVTHCRGKVRFFQNDSEPNNPIYWSGTASEFATETRAFSKAVRETDPRAKVVLGGYDGLFNPGPGFKYPTQEASLAFFRTVLTEAPNTFDYFDLRLYADPLTIPARVAYIRQMMAEHGGEKPIFCTEYNGPGFFEMRENLKYVPLVVKWSSQVASQGADRGQNGVSELYKDPASLPPQTQMFLMGGDKDLDAKLRRMQCRDLVIRNVLALSAGVSRTMFWDFWHDTTQRDDVMTLMYGKLKMFELEGGKFVHPYPVAEAFARMTSMLRGVTSIRPVTDIASNVMAFEADCGRRGSVLVAWTKADPMSEEPAGGDVSLPWKSSSAVALDALGASPSVRVGGGQVTLKLGPTPVFIGR